MNGSDARADLGDVAVPVDQLVDTGAHEAHHRSQVVLALKAAGHPLPKSVPFGLWELGVR